MPTLIRVAALAPAILAAGAASTGTGSGPDTSDLGRAMPPAGARPPGDRTERR
ncbi:hypothetical protein [Methylobacterium sp. ID0610]|uniref:hypothetical protein n=1 Tax=Methylobacterium carpenticola TaxID=3344827 RepID=UPI00368FFD50